MAHISRVREALDEAQAMADLWTHLSFRRAEKEPGLTRLEQKSQFYWRKVAADFATVE
jgi:hypothetical protein